MNGVSDGVSVSDADAEWEQFLAARIGGIHPEMMVNGDLKQHDMIFLKQDDPPGLKLGENPGTPRTQWSFFHRKIINGGLSRPCLIPRGYL